MRFIKYNPETDMAKYLQTKPIANHLANIIATRARRTDCPYTGLKVGQCFLGDIKKIGITPKQYRTAKLLLERIGFSTFLGANKGTTATLVSIEVYDINAGIKGDPQVEQGGELEDKQGANKGRLTKKVKEREELKELKKKEGISFIDEIREILLFFVGSAGKNLRIADSDSKLSRSDKYKKILPRLKEGATVDECKQIITLKTKQWKGDSVMDSSLCIQTLFRPSNFSKYLDEIDNVKVPLVLANYMPPYPVPPFVTTDKRNDFFYARISKFHDMELLDERLFNTEYKKRGLYEKDAESLCYELEQQNPELSKIEIKYQIA